MASFFEDDQDEIRVGETVYLDFFNLYPELRFQSTLEYLNQLDEAAVLDFSQTSDGWQIEVRFNDAGFLLDTHYHGTSTLFCVEKRGTDKKIMLAFLGCFLPLVRDDWKANSSVVVKKTNWIARVFGRLK